jgi:hypothetical protein
MEVAGGGVGVSRGAGTGVEPAGKESAMVDRTEATGAAADEPRTVAADAFYQDGIVAGLIGAVTIAIWFLILDTARGRPLYTPSLLGTAIFRHGQALASPETLPVSFEMVLMYTFVHGLVFCVIGGVAARLLQLAEDRPNFGFGIVLLFVVFEFGFVGAAMVFAEPVLHALAWPAVLVGNLLAAGAMATYLWRRHRTLTIRP